MSKHFLHWAPCGCGKCVMFYSRGKVGTNRVTNKTLYQCMRCKDFFIRIDRKNFILFNIYGGKNGIHKNS
jgi:hypothetical protein